MIRVIYPEKENCIHRKGSHFSCELFVEPHIPLESYMNFNFLYLPPAQWGAFHLQFQFAHQTCLQIPPLPELTASFAHCAHKLVWDGVDLVTSKDQVRFLP